MDGSRVGQNRAQVKNEDLPLLLAQRVACIRNNEKSMGSLESKNPNQCSIKDSKTRKSMIHPQTCAMTNMLLFSTSRIEESSFGNSLLLFTSPGTAIAQTRLDIMWIAQRAATIQNCSKVLPMIPKMNAGPQLLQNASILLPSFGWILPFVTA